jgi:hypothetical protein
MLEIEKDQVVGVLNRLACRPLHPLFIAGIRIWHTAVARHARDRPGLDRHEAA